MDYWFECAVEPLWIARGLTPLNKILFDADLADALRFTPIEKQLNTEITEDMGAQRNNSCAPCALCVDLLIMALDAGLCVTGGDIT